MKSKELAVRVNNKYQFEAVLDKYHRKDWRDFIEKYTEPCCIVLGETFSEVKFFGEKGVTYMRIPDEIQIVDWDVFSKLTGIHATEEIIVKVNPVETRVTKNGARFDKPIEVMSSTFITEVYLAYKSLID